MKFKRFYRFLFRDLFRLIVISTTVWGVYESFLSIRDFINRPILKVGVLPLWDYAGNKLPKSKLGNYDPEHEFTFNDAVFGIPIKYGGANIFTELSAYPDNSIEVGRTEGKYVTLPILVNNVGHDNLRDFELTMAFCEPQLPGEKVDSTLNVVDFSSESLDLKELFVDKEKFNGSPIYAAKIPDKNIYGIYRQLGLTEDYISVRGILEGNNFQVLYLKLLVPPGLREFAVVFQTDSRQIFFRNGVFGQLVKIINTGEKIS